MDALSFVAAAALQLAALSAVMAIASVIHQRTSNAGWIDTIWTFGLGAVGVVSALVPLAVDAAAGRKVVVAAMIGLWAVRLGVHLIGRSSQRPDDPRYNDLVRKWGPDARRQMFWLLQKQALVSSPLALAILIAANTPATWPRPQDLIAILIVAVSIAGEALADRQLRQFAATPANKGRVCDVGLWRASRHPNYFFEWLHWVAYPVLAIGISGDFPLGWIALTAPLCMYWLLNFVSGVPPLEEHMERKYGEAYRIYQRRTSAFFPWFSARAT